jgi:hypothetical protein
MLNKQNTILTKSTLKVAFLGYLINHGSFHLMKMFTYQRAYPSKQKSAGDLRRIKINRSGNIRLFVDTRKVIHRLFYLMTKSFVIKTENLNLTLTFYLIPKALQFIDVQHILFNERPR